MMYLTIFVFRNGLQDGVSTFELCHLPAVVMTVGSFIICIQLSSSFLTYHHLSWIGFYLHFQYSS